MTTLTAKDAILTPATTDIVDDEGLNGLQGITLKPGIEAAVNNDSRQPDITFQVSAPQEGTYVIRTFSVVDDEGHQLMEEAKGKYDSLFLKLQIDQTRPTKRVVYVPWHRPHQTTGKFHLTGKPQELKLWIPRGVRLGHVSIHPYVEPAVPKAAQNYEPKWKPPTSHPRLWCNQETLPVIRKRLESDEHQEAWQTITRQAKKPFNVEFSPDEEVAHDAALEKAAEAKAFYYLMTGDKEVGREAVQLMNAYLSQVEFGNILDITREIGRAIYTGSLVYDWCHDLLSVEEKDAFHKSLKRLALDMECGWPPFRQTIITGHGAEAQINRDLLSMSIALYEREPEMYKYTSYVILENLVPMRKFEFQSPRYNQGVNYGAFRFGWEMHAAWLLYRMSGEPAFDENIKDVRRFWQYMRMPDGMMLRDGDGASGVADGRFYYWKYPRTMLLMYTYASDPLLKADFYRQGGPSSDPMMFLLLNDPELKPIDSLESLPLTKDFGPILGSMVARTGWNLGLDSNDVVAEIKGGGYHFGNHQHADAGSLQVYFRGLQVADLGLYKFYGTPYDRNFNKRSIAHSMMLAVDPKEEYRRAESNDGGTRYNQTAPRTPQQVTSDPWFNNGEVIATDFGPSELKPDFSYFKANLTDAYSDKLSKYSRGFCFINLKRSDVPAAIILTDDMTTQKADFQKFWQVNTLHDPQMTEDGFILKNERSGLTGNTHVKLLLPSSPHRSVKVHGGKDATNVFGMQLDPPPSPHPEANGYRIMVSPTNNERRHRFLTVFQMVDGNSEPLPVEHREQEETYVIAIADRVVVISNNVDFVQKSFPLHIPKGPKRQVALLGLKPGSWIVRDSTGKMIVEAEVKAKSHATFFQAEPGKYEVSPH
ncbi:hypothetical protein [Bremerella alba]|nr:hypothetical protein [Bremerella alba]